MAHAFSLNADSSLRRPSQEELRAIDGDTQIITLLKGLDGFGGPWWGFIGVKPSRYAEFHRRSAACEAITISDYGTLLLSGSGDTPSPEAYAHMREHYGWDEQYTEKLIAELHRQQKAHFDQREASRINDIVAMLKAQQKPG